MPYNVSRSVNTVKKEVLKFPAGLDAIESVVLAASAAPELPSAVTGTTGVRGYRAGTVLKKAAGDSQNRYVAYGGAGTVAGILGDNIYFYDDTDASDEAADMLFHGCVFNVNKLVGDDRDYEGNESAVQDALHTCRFEVGEDE